MKLKKKSQLNYKNRIKKRAETNAKYYLKNKEHLLAKAINRKKNEEEDIKWSFMKDRETSLKTKLFTLPRGNKNIRSISKQTEEFYHQRTWLLGNNCNKATIKTH